MWDALKIVGIVFAVVAGFGLLQLIYFTAVMAWAEAKTEGLEYYGKPPAERAAFKGALRRHATMLWPLMRWLSRKDDFKFETATFVAEGVAGPKGTCSKESFERAMAYEPGAEDVFVVTQMKCGTTWMQHVVFEILQRGGGTLVDDGKTLYGVSPWIEARKSVPMETAPVLGTERPSRVIKTHLPADACPFSEAARYVYVVRHPVSCFASCVDFIGTNIGAFAPPLTVTEAWFCNPELMWWRPWPQHVEGWWQRSESHDNVLFLSFEEMKADLPSTVDTVTEFLGMAPLTTEERAEVVRKCGFAYMKEHADAFEMHPPHLLQTDAELFKSGKSDRHKDVPNEARQRVAAWCVEQLAGKQFPLQRYYSDVVGAQ